MYQIRWTLNVRLPHDGRNLVRSGIKTFESQRKGIAWAVREGEKLWKLLVDLYPEVMLNRATYSAKMVEPH